MRQVIYDVAVSLDGFIAGPDGDIAAFPAQGDHVAAYLERLQGYGTVIMGRRTYQFGYRYGLVPGARAYPHMDHHVFSRRLALPAGSDVAVVREGWTEAIQALKAQPGAPIYLCGGGTFAGWLAARGQIDVLRLKIAPAVIGVGVPLFGAAGKAVRLRHLCATIHASGVVFAEYRVLCDEHIGGAAGGRPALIPSTASDRLGMNHQQPLTGWKGAEAADRRPAVHAAWLTASPYPSRALRDQNPRHRKARS